MKYFAIACALLAVISLGGAYVHVRMVQSESIAVETYVREHISQLSPEQEVLGGTFFVTKIEIDAKRNEGYVEYEDGHVLYVADFGYELDQGGEINIHALSVRQ